MGILEHSGFEHGYLPAGWEHNDASGPTSVAVASDQAYSGTYSNKVVFSTNDTYYPDDFQYDTGGDLNRTSAAATTSTSMGVAIRSTDFSAFTGGCRPIVMVRDGSISYDLELQVEITGGGQVALKLDGGTALDTLWTSAPGLIQDDVWHYFELRVVFDSTVGAIDFAINGTTVYTSSSADTDNMGNGVPTTAWTPGMRFATQSNGGSTLWIDDYFVADGLTGLLGPQFHEFLTPDGSTESDGTGSDGNSTDNHLLVDDVPFSGTDYIDLDVATDREVYSFANRTDTGDVNALTMHAQLHNTDVGSVTSNGLLISNVTETDGTDIVLATVATPQAVVGPLLTDPDTAAAWTNTGVNAVTGGVEVSAIV